MREHLIQKSFVEPYLITNDIRYNVDLFQMEGIAIDGIMYVERGILRMLCPGITNQQILDMEVSVKASQTADFTPPSIDFNSIANVDTVVVADLVRDKKVYKGLIFTDPNTGLEVDLQEYSGEDANAVAPNAAPTPPTIIENSRGRKSVSVSFTGATDSDGTISGYNMYIDGGFHSSTTGTSATLVGLEPGTEYELSVHSVDDDLLQSTAASFLTFTTSTAVNTLPTKPTLVYPSQIQFSTARLNVSGGTDSDGTVIGYNAYAATFGGSEFLGSSIGNADVGQINLTGLDSNTSYAINVKTVDNDGEESFLGHLSSFSTLQEI